MELSSTTLQGSLSTTVLTKVDSFSEEDTTQFNENDVVFVPHSARNTFKTTGTAVTSIISNSTVTMDNVIITDATGSTIKSHYKFSIEKHSSHICLAFVILFVIAIVLIPIILYYTISPQEGSFLNVVDFKNCSVST